MKDEKVVISLSVSHCDRTRTHRDDCAAKSHLALNPILAHLTDAFAVLQPMDAWRRVATGLALEDPTPTNRQGDVRGRASNAQVGWAHRLGCHFLDVFLLVTNGDGAVRELIRN